MATFRPTIAQPGYALFRFRGWNGTGSTPVKLSLVDLVSGLDHKWTDGEQVQDLPPSAVANSAFLCAQYIELGGVPILTIGDVDLQLRFSAGYGRALAKEQYIHLLPAGGFSVTRDDEHGNEIVGHNVRVVLDSSSSDRAARHMTSNIVVRVFDA